MGFIYGVSSKFPRECAEKLFSNILSWRQMCLIFCSSKHMIAQGYVHQHWIRTGKLPDDFNFAYLWILPKGDAAVPKHPLTLRNRLLIQCC